MSHRESGYDDDRPTDVLPGLARSHRRRRSRWRWAIPPTLIGLLTVAAIIGLRGSVPARETTLSGPRWQPVNVTDLRIRELEAQLAKAEDELARLRDLSGYMVVVPERSVPARRPDRSAPRRDHRRGSPEFSPPPAAPSPRPSVSPMVTVQAVAPAPLPSPSAAAPEPSPLVVSASPSPEPTKKRPKGYARDKPASRHAASIPCAA